MRCSARTFESCLLLDPGLSAYRGAGDCSDNADFAGRSLLFETISLVCNRNFSNFCFGCLPIAPCHHLKLSSFERQLS